MTELTPVPIHSDVIQADRKVAIDYSRWLTELRALLNVLTLNIRVGLGSPEGVVTAPQGAIFLRSDGAAGTTVYSKTTGGTTTPTNTGWVAVT